MPVRRRTLLAFILLVSSPWTLDARVVKLRIDRREAVLNSKPFGLAGAYEKLIGKVEFALDPASPANSGVIDLTLAPRNARGEAEFTADFYLLKPLDPARGNGRLLYEVGNRGGKGLLQTFQKAKASRDPTTAAEFGDGSLMSQGFSLLWMGWQWDIPDGQMRMDMPIATDHGATITGLVRGNFVLNARSATAPVADRNHKAYPVANPADPDSFLTVRDRVLDPPRRIPRAGWHFVDDNTVALDGGFEPGRIYDVVYRARDPRVVGVGLAGTRDLIAFLKHTGAEANPVRGVRFAYGWGVSQSSRLLRHFLYEGFNEDEQGRQVFDGVIDEVGGAGRGSFNHRFAQASRDAEQFFNILYPVAGAGEWNRRAAEPAQPGPGDALACRFYVEHGERLLADEPLDAGAGRAFIRYQPIGPVLAVMPRNFPFWQVFRFAAPALMAGNAGLLKHASNVPQCALAIEEIIRRAGFPGGIFQTLMIGSAQVGRVIDDPRVKAATLTGSEPAGAQVASRAGAQLKKTVLELGGSDPFIVMPSADLDRAIPTAVEARTINNGQSCIAAKRFIVDARIGDEFERRFVAGMEALRVGDPMDERDHAGGPARHTGHSRRAGRSGEAVRGSRGARADRCQAD